MKQFLIVLQLVLLFSPLSFSQERWDFLWEGNARDCYVYLPQSRGDQAGLPVVFDLHGYGGSSNEARTYHRSHILGDSVGFITIYPDAFDKRWNSGLGDTPGWPTPNVDDVGFISLIIDSLISRYKIDTARVYACGHSNGGFMCLKLAGRLGNRIAAVASVAGVIAISTAASYTTTRPVPALTMNGTGDNLLPYYDSTITGLLSVNQTIEFLRNKNNCLLPAEVILMPDINPNDQSTVVKYIYRSSTNTSQVVHYKIIGGGHEWPGSPTYAGATVINRDIDATKEIWNFFKQFPDSNPRFTTSSHDAKLDRSYYRPGLDSIALNVTIFNPMKHSTKLAALINDISGVRYDSITLYNDGLHGDGSPDDSVWGCRFLAPASENKFTVNIRTDDLTEGTFHLLPQLKRFFTNGPVKFKNVVFASTDTIPNPGDIFRLKFRLGNFGTVDTVKNVTAFVSTLDTVVTLGTVSPFLLGNLPPGKDSLASYRQEVRINPFCPTPTTVRLLLTISTEDIPAWTDTVSFMIQPTRIIISDNMLPTEFSLDQNYPNPFNPTTVISYQLPVISKVSLKIYDLLGREIATLVNEEQSAGWKEVEWNASNFSSGMYLVRMQTNNFTETKKILMMK